jgi:hypothetical protein
LGIDLFKSVLMYSNGAICLIKLLFDLGLFTVYIALGSRQRIMRVHKREGPEIYLSLGLTFFQQEQLTKESVSSVSASFFITMGFTKNR